MLKEENMKYLKKNGIVMYIHRMPEDIIKTVNTENRPLLKDDAKKLNDIYAARHKLYLKYADVCISNSGDFQSGVLNAYNAVKNILL